MDSSQFCRKTNTLAKRNKIRRLLTLANSIGQAHNNQSRASAYVRLSSTLDEHGAPISLFFPIAIVNRKLTTIMQRINKAINKTNLRCLSSPCSTFAHIYTIMKQDDSTSNLKNKLGKLPPPLFGEDDCDRPACHDMMSQMKKASQASQDKKAVECPPNSGVLGRASWTLLHTMVRTNITRTSVF
jgi:hypothetical protein